ncbi:uncharacterized protein si:dkey-283b1.6 [Triplophysa dalaica]|uniref:uncharacterized protein si:dkey-283b1.6 n=1 Tax=Triplophysa dalaica TaxID=1582913 RepID=UPI0024DF6E97|nr:uncharacterized protein si:dkey-283b1.6 [Triplophysa dalaica]
MNDTFAVFQIFIPIIIFGVVTFCCASFCKIFYRTREERQQRLAAENLARDVSSSVYVIPISLTDDDVHRPPRYSTVQLYDPPPAYNQVKFEAYPPEPPPPYTQAAHS